MPADLQTRLSNDAKSVITWWIWMALQLAMLGLFAGQVPLTARFPLPIEDSAAIAVLIVQITSAVLLAGRLVPTARHVASAIAGGGPLLVAAALLAGVRIGDVAIPFVLLICWLAALCGRKRNGIVDALSAVAVLATPVAWFAAAEASSATSLHGWAIFSPSLAAISTFRHLAGWWEPFVLPATLIMTNVINLARFRSVPPAYTAAQ